MRKEITMKSGSIALAFLVTFGHAAYSAPTKAPKNPNASKEHPAAHDPRTNNTAGEGGTTGVSGGSAGPGPEDRDRTHHGGRKGQDQAEQNAKKSSSNEKEHNSEQ